MARDAVEGVEDPLRGGACVAEPGGEGPVPRVASVIRRLAVAARPRRRRLVVAPRQEVLGLGGGALDQRLLDDAALGERLDRVRRLAVADEARVDERADDRGGGRRRGCGSSRGLSPASVVSASSSAAPRAASASSIAASASAFACSSAPTIIMTSGVSMPLRDEVPAGLEHERAHARGPDVLHEQHRGVLALADLVGQATEVLEREAGGARRRPPARARRRCRDPRPRR